MALLKSFATTLPMVAPVATILFIVFFVYSVLGVSLWSEVEFSRHASFKTFGDSFYTLFRVSSGEDWCACIRVHTFMAGWTIWSQERCLSTCAHRKHDRTSGLTLSGRVPCAGTPSCMRA